MVERNYRDAVHNIIRVDTATASGDLIARLIDTSEFQRLRRVRQLGLAYFAYQTAEHSRFTHSLGAYHLADRLLTRLASRYEISAEDALAVRVAALVHDVGHGPFSHVIESVLQFHHEDYTIETVTSETTSLGRVLREHSPGLAPAVADIIRGGFRRMALGQIVSSQLDVDRMDYLLRDSLMTGVKYGIYDLEWVMKSIEIDEDRDQLYVSRNGLYAVEDYLQSRYYMFRQVYFHRTLRAAEAVLHSLLKRALKLHAEGGDVWFAKRSAMGRVLAGESLTVEQHLSLDDSDMLFHIKCWRSSSDTILSDLAKRFVDRRIFKAFELNMHEDASDLAKMDAARGVLEQKGFDPDYYLVRDRSGESPNFFYSSGLGEAKDLIYVQSGSGRTELQEISEISDAVRGLQKGYRLDRVCFPGEVREQIEAIFREA